VNTDVRLNKAWKVEQSSKNIIIFNMQSPYTLVHENTWQPQSILFDCKSFDDSEQAFSNVLLSPPLQLGNWWTK